MSVSPSPEEKILFVDDEPNILAAYERQFHKRFVLNTALGPRRGIELLDSAGPYAVIVSDLRMPWMTGIQFLAEAKRIAPQSVRIMLTGFADTAAAVSAVNQGNIFRFLHKPCVAEVLGRTIETALEHHRTLLAEHVLPQETLQRTIDLLAGMLELSQPTTSRQTARIREIVQHMTVQLQRTDPWKFEAAAALSLIGCVAVPAGILAKVIAGAPLSAAERTVFEAHPQAGHDLLVRIPQLRDVAAMIGRQHSPHRESSRADDAVLGGQMLRAATDFDSLQTAGVARREALARMRSQGDYHPEVLDALGTYHPLMLKNGVREVWVRELVHGMITEENVSSPAGLLLLAKGEEITPSVKTYLEGLALTHSVLEPILVGPAKESLVH